MLQLPKLIIDSTLSSLIPFVQIVRESSEEAIDIDARNTVFIDPVGLCVLASLCETLAKQNRKINLHNLRKETKSYLARMDLLQHCGYEYNEKVTRLDRRDSLVEVSCVDMQEDVDRVSSQISQCVVGSTPGYNENAPFDKMTGHQPHTQLEDNLKYLFNELLENSLTHGRRHGYRDSNVWVASQYYPKKDVLKLGIVDNGCGFLRTLEGHVESPHSDNEAIQLALKAYTSCNRDVGIMSDSYNEGVGLTVISRIVASADGELNIFSGKALNKYKAGDLRCSAPLNNSEWKGVGISILMPRQSINKVLYREVVRKIRDETSKKSDKVDIQFI
jgi:anti-anti-sigma regulatory factor/two-component sensor histidine kinase